MLALNLYIWVSAIGFPLIACRWLTYERKMSGQDYKTGHDDGWVEGYGYGLEDGRWTGKFDENGKPIRN